MSGLDDLAQKEAEIQELKAKLERAKRFLPGDAVTIVESGIEEPLHLEETSLLIFDLADSTKTADKYRQAGLVDLFLDSRLQLMTEAKATLTKRGLKVWKEMGDAMYSYATGQHNEAQALLAAAELVKLMHEKYTNHEVTAPPGTTIPEELKNPNLRIRIGTAKGTVQKGVDNLGDKDSYDLNGPPVNLAARCEGEAKHRQALISEELNQTLTTQGIKLQPRTIQAKGITTDGQENTARVYDMDYQAALKILRHLNTHDTTHIIQKQTPYFGRQQELAQILTNTGTLTITGEPGIGRTRLLQEAAKQTHAHQLKGNATDQSPFGAFIEYFKQTQYNVGENNDAIRKLLGQEPITPEEQGKQLSDRIKQAIQTHFTTHPEPIYIDDEQWLDAQTRDTLTKLKNPKVITTTGQANITLQPLDNQAVTEYANHLTTKLTPEQQKQYAQLIAQAKGNPLFIQLIAEELNTHLKQGTLPNTVKANITQQLEHQYNTLDQELQNALRIIATMRGEINPTTVETILKRPVKWEELLKKSIIIPTQTGYTLHRPAFADAVNKTIRSKDKQQLHQLIATTLDASHATMAYHHEHAGNTQQAIQHLRQAAEDDMKLYGREEATKKLERAIELLDIDNDSTLQETETAMEAQIRLIGIWSFNDTNFRQRVEKQQKLAEILQSKAEQAKTELEKQNDTINKTKARTQYALAMHNYLIAAKWNNDVSAAVQYAQEAYEHARKLEPKSQDKAMMNLLNAKLEQIAADETSEIESVVKTGREHILSRNGDIDTTSERGILWNVYLMSAIQEGRKGELTIDYVRKITQELDEWIAKKGNDSLIKNDIYNLLIPIPPLFKYSRDAAEYLLPIVQQMTDEERTTQMQKRRPDNALLMVSLFGLAHLNIAAGQTEIAQQYFEEIEKTRPDFWKHFQKGVEKLKQMYN